MTKTVGGVADGGAALGYLTALLALVAMGACSGRSTGGGGTMGSGAAGQAALPIGSVDWPEAAPLPEPEIPPFPDLCSEFQIQLTPGPSRANIDCPCARGLYLCDGPSCATSVDCDAVCAVWLDGSRPQVTECVGFCTTDADCGGFPCVRIPGAAKGACFGDWCLDDDDCFAGLQCVAVRSDGVRRCAESSECNTTADCAEGKRCALPEQSFVGTCGDGGDRSVCYRDTDCRAGRRCIHGSDLTDSPDRGRCTTGLATAPCGDDGDCVDHGKCFFRSCSNGGVDEGCQRDDDCETGLQCVNVGSYDPTYAICANGNVGSTCERTSQCATGNYCSHHMCSDGSATTSYCDQDSQCQSGRCLVGGIDEQCTSGEVGARCLDAEDCLSGSCHRDAGLRTADPGVCD